MYMIIYIRPIPLPPGVAWISMPRKPESTLSGGIADKEAFTEPVVNAVVVVVQKAEKNPPILVSMPAAAAGIVWRKPINKFRLKSP